MTNKIDLRFVQAGAENGTRTVDLANTRAIIIDFHQDEHAALQSITVTVGQSEEAEPGILSKLSAATLITKVGDCLTAELGNTALNEFLDSFGTVDDAPAEGPGERA